MISLVELIETFHQGEVPGLPVVDLLIISLDDLRLGCLHLCRLPWLLSLLLRLRSDLLDLLVLDLMSLLMLDMKMRGRKVISELRLGVRHASWHLLKVSWLYGLILMHYGLSSLLIVTKGKRQVYTARLTSRLSALSDNPLFIANNPLAFPK